MDFSNTLTRVAVDFDGTIVAHEYPKIGKTLPFAFETLKALQKKGFRLILWTVRTGDLLEEAIVFCRKHGVNFYAVNKNYPEEEWTPDTSRKIEADIFIDDRNIGGFLGWGEIYQKLVPEENVDYLSNHKKSFFSRIFNK